MLTFKQFKRICSFRKHFEGEVLLTKMDYSRTFEDFIKLMRMKAGSTPLNVDERIGKFFPIPRIRNRQLALSRFHIIGSNELYKRGMSILMPYKGDPVAKLGAGDSYLIKNYTLRHFSAKPAGVAELMQAFANSPETPEDFLGWGPVVALEFIYHDSELKQDFVPVMYYLAHEIYLAAVPCVKASSGPSHYRQRALSPSRYLVILSKKTRDKLERPFY